MSIVARLKEKLDFSFLSVIFALAWPTMLEQLLHTAVQYVDTAMVGSLGTEATGAVGATTTVNWLVGSSISALGIGFLAFISQALGAKKGELAKKASAQSVLIVLAVGLLFTAVTTLLSPFVPAWMQVDPLIRDTASRYFLILYLPMLPRTASIIFGSVLRSAGDTKTPMRIGIAVNIINVILNFCLIFPTREVTVLSYSFTMFGVGLGVDGAAIASATAFTVGGVLITVALFRHPLVSPLGKGLKPDMSVLKPCMRVAIPNMLQRFGTSLGYVAFATMINSIGVVATTAHTIANTVESAFYVPGFGMQAAAATLAGNAVGAGDSKRIDALTNMLVLCEVVLMTASGGLLFAFAPEMVHIFSDDPSVIATGATVLRMVALSEPFYGISIVLEGMMLGMGNTVTPFVCNMIGMWGVRILGTFVCVVLLGYGLVAAWACMIAHNLLLFLMFSLRSRGGRLYKASRALNK